MSRNITAVYRTFSVADLVRRELEAEGISSSNIHIVPDRDTVGAEDYQSFDNDLHDLHLPDEDLRTYQNCVRNGDFIVSVESDDDDHDTQIKQIMRRPEAETYRLDDRESQYLTHPTYPHSDSSRVPPTTDRLARRDPDQADDYVRSYRRGAL